MQPGRFMLAIYTLPYLKAPIKDPLGVSRDDAVEKIRSRSMSSLADTTDNFTIDRATHRAFMDALSVAPMWMWLLLLDAM